MNKFKLVFLLFFINGIIVAQTPCENGSAAGFPCENIDLLAHLPIDEVGGAQSLNDIWGWTDPQDGAEYIVLGKSNGTAFINITDPLNPVYLGTLPTHTFSSTWRDVKVYENHAYIVSEAPGHGMQVFDLTELRDVANPPVEFSETFHYGMFGNCHNIIINEETGFAYAVGTDTFDGGLHIIDLSNPADPQIAGDFAEDGYTHDAQAVIYNGPDQEYTGREMVFACNENTLTIVDAEDKQDCQQVAREGYVGNSYSHQGWLTEDHRYFILDDETDESNFGHNTKTYVWDVQDLDDPFVVGVHFGPTQAIDHNLYIRDNCIYQSNYHAGLRILQMVDLASADLEEVAYFDILPSNNSVGFNGNWSNYPYFDSEVIAVSGISQGLFLLNSNVDCSTVGVEDMSHNRTSDVTVFPNPTTEAINIKFGDLKLRNVDLQVINIAGKVIVEQKNIPIIGGTINLQLPKVESGIYAVRFPGHDLETKSFIVK